MEVKISLNDINCIVPVFDGNPDDLSKFISCGNILFSYIKEDTQHALFLDIVKTRLQGPAFELIQYKTITKWTDLVTELEGQFQDQISRSAAQNELASAKQNGKESVKDFGDRLMHLLHSLDRATYGDTSDTTIRDFLVKENSKLAIRSFEDGLRNSSLRLLVKANKAQSLKTAIAYNTEQSLRLEDSNSPSSRNPRPTCQTCNKVGHTSATCYVSAGRNRSPICQTCNKMGHTSATCYRNTNSPSFPPQRIKREVQRLQCTYCNRYNHTYNECRTRLSQSKPLENPHTNPFRNGRSTGPNSRPQSSFHGRNHDVRYNHVSQNGQKNFNNSAENDHARAENNGSPSRAQTTADVHRTPI